MVEKSTIIQRVSIDGGDKWRRRLRVAKSPLYSPPCCCREFGEAQIAGTVSQKPLTTKRWRKCFITTLPPFGLPPLPLRLPPKLSHFQICLHSNLRYQTLIDSEGWSRRRETPNRRRRAQRKQEPKHGVMKSGCCCIREKRS